MDRSIRAELLRLETALVTRNGRDIEGGLAGLIADDFLELGASGAVWDAAATRRLVASEPPTDMELEAFDAVELAPSVVLVTYRSARRPLAGPVPPGHLAPTADGAHDAGPAPGGGSDARSSALNASVLPAPTPVGRKELP